MHVKQNVRNIHIMDGGGHQMGRKEPSQQRSRERVERMLSAATELIEQHGSDSLRMAEVAVRAGVSIGSLYQFFPDKAAIIRALAERITAESRACIDEALADVDGEDDLRREFAALIDTYYALFLDRPVMRDIWSATQTDKVLHDLELADSRKSAELLTAILRRLRPGVDKAKLEAATFLIWQLGEATMRLAISVDRAEGDQLVEAYKHMALREMFA